MFNLPLVGVGKVESRKEEVGRSYTGVNCSDVMVKVSL